MLRSSYLSERVKLEAVLLHLCRCKLITGVFTVIPAARTPAFLRVSSLMATWWWLPVFSPLCSGADSGSQLSVGIKSAYVCMCEKAQVSTLWCSSAWARLRVTHVAGCFNGNCSIINEDTLQETWWLFCSAGMNTKKRWSVRMWTETPWHFIKAEDISHRTLRQKNRFSRICN